MAQLKSTKETKNMSILKTIAYILAAIIVIPIVCAVIGAFVFGMGEGIDNQATSAPATSTPKATSAPIIKMGTYENPAQLGESFLSQTGALRITVTEVERGDQVYAYIANENMFNDEPAPGHEYMVVKIKFEYLDGDRKFLLSGYDFKAYANNVECEKPFLVMPDRYPEMGSVDLMPGGSVEKWIVYEAPKGEQVTIAYERLFVSAIYYFDAGSGNYS